MDDSDEDQGYVGEDEDESESSDDGVSAAKITNRPQVGLKLMFFTFLRNCWQNYNYKLATLL